MPPYVPNLAYRNNLMRLVTEFDRSLAHIPKKEGAGRYLAVNLREVSPNTLNHILQQLPRLAVY